jgi:hypothetical protein
MLELVGLGEIFSWLFVKASFKPVLTPEYLAMKKSEFPVLNELFKVIVPKVMEGL